MAQINITRGDIVYADLRGAIGYEKQGKRPCLVIQNDTGNRHSPLTIVAPITDQRQGKELLVRVLVPAAELGPGGKDSVVELGHIRALDQNQRIERVVSRVSAATMASVDAAIKVSLGVRSMGSCGQEIPSGGSFSDTPEASAAEGADDARTMPSVGGQDLSEVALESRISLYGVLFAKFNQEGDAIWSRFNMMLGSNLALFAGFAYVLSYARDAGRDLAAVLWLICLAGLLHVIWSHYVLHRLWRWHQHWRDQLTIVEESFSPSFPRPHVASLDWCKLDPGSSRIKGATGRRFSRRPSYTQPFLWGAAAAWVCLGVFLGLGVL